METLIEDNSRRMSQESPQSITDNSVAGGTPGRAVCSLCETVLSPEPEAIDELEYISICGDCKFLLLEDLETPSRESRRRRPPSRRRIRYSSSESVEDRFSQQFSHLINLVRPNLDDPQLEGDQTGRSIQRTSARTTPDGSRRWRRIFSDTDTESEGFDNADSGYAESESPFQFGGDSDASVDLNGFLDIDEGSDYETDTDIDPMHAGLNHWNSDNARRGDELEEEQVEEEEIEWEEGDAIDDGARRSVSSSDSVDMNRTDDPLWAVHVSERGVQEFLLLLARDEHLRRGAPPAAAAFVNSLPRIVIGDDYADHDDMSCAICKDALVAGSEVNRLPCDHLYHPFCILPWLSTRNSCPLCRYELPTDDKEYEEGKRRIIAAEDVSVTFFDREEDGEEDREVGTERGELPAANSGRGGRWLLLAGPIVGFVGIVLVLWLGHRGNESPGQIGGIQINRGGSSSGRRADRSRRWWSLF